MSNCPLCNLEKKTRWHYEDEKIVICDCESCKIPMLVLKQHGEMPSPGERGRLLQLCEEVFKTKVSFRGYMRKHPQHWHEHLIIHPSFNKKSSK